MAVFWTLMTLVFSLGACSNNAVVSAYANEEVPENICGSWTGIDNAEDLFQLEINCGENQAEIHYYNGGPFIERFEYKRISESEIELYHKSLEGSTSFMRAAESKARECATAVMKCRLISENEIEVSTFAYDCGYVPQNIKIVLRRETEEIQVERPEENPFVELVKEYKPEELQHLLDKAQPQNIKDFFLLLPEEDCFEIPAELRVQMLQNKPLEQWDYMAIEEVDVENRYLNLTGPLEGKWEMYAQEVDDVWFIAVNWQVCGPACYTEIAKTYIYDNGQLILDYSANLAGYQDLWPELFIDFSMLNEEQERAAREIWEENKYEVLYDLPRDGKTVSMYVEPLLYIDEDIPWDAFRTVESEIWK